MDAKIKDFGGLDFGGLKLGDKNTRFFHAATLVRTRKNKIDVLMDNNNQWV